MGKVTTLLSILVLLVSTLAGAARSPLARAQTIVPPVSCSGNAAPAPMQGHYTGPWHSEGDYHFLALGYDIDLQIIIDGTIDATVTPDGRLTGTVQGKVDAPETHGGQHDVASGYGTISGQLQGTVAAGNAQLVLSRPVIDMQWGTFVGGGYTVEQRITMPDYQFPTSLSSCVTTQGTIAEKDFPTEYILDDAKGTMTALPGIGSATGSWQLTSDAAAQFDQLSQQVDSFITQANSLLSDPATALTPSLVDQRVAEPLQQLENTIRQNPNVARCLLDRLGSWEASTIPALLLRASSIGAATLSALRQAGDLLRAAGELNLDCGIDVASSLTSLAAAGDSALDSAFTARSWPDVFLLVRELLLLNGAAGRPVLQQRVDTDLHTFLASSSRPSDLLAVARLAYVLGDDVDATAAYQQISGHAVDLRPSSNLEALRAQPGSANRGPLVAKPKKPRKKPSHPTTPKPTRTPTPKATPKPTSTPTPTPTPRPKTLREVLVNGIAAISTLSVPGTNQLSWEPVPDAVRYLVTAAAPDMSILWAWSGTSTAVTYGDTALDGTPSDDAWPDLGSTPTTWSVLALDAQGQIVGAAFRVGG
jgi:hypothetical protein